LNLAGHSAVIHGCTVEDEAFVGMGAILLDGVVVEKNAMVAAGALVRQNTRIPSGEVCLQILLSHLNLPIYLKGSLYVICKYTLSNLEGYKFII
jgi:tetrahydrodipicolinate N-succinyltransferase